MDWHIEIIDDRVKIGERFSLSFQRTLRLPDDGRTYPLPPTLGLFPVRRVADYSDRLPREWSQRGGVFFPMYQREAMWLAFDTTEWKPNAVKIGIGGIDALTGEDWQRGLHDDPQDYLVCPEQMWLDGINSGEGTIRQFVAMPLGMGYTVEGQLTGEEKFGGVQILVYDPMKGRFPDEAPPEQDYGLGSPGGPLAFSGPMGAPMADMAPLDAAQMDMGMGLGAGGQMQQKVYPDPYGLDTWDQDNYAALEVHILNSAQFQAVTGEAPPPTPVTAQTYNKHGLPWFELYDETQGDLAAAEKLAGVKTVRELDEERGDSPDAAEAETEIKPEQVRRINKKEGRSS